MNSIDHCVPLSLHWLASAQPHLILKSLRGSGELAQLLPEVDALYGVPQNPDHHPEICTGLHVELCLAMAVRLGASVRARYAVLTHDLGKALTPKAEWPKHIDHENRGRAPVKALGKRLGVPEDWGRLALTVCEQHLDAHRALEMRSQSVLRFLENTSLDGSGLPSSETAAVWREDFLLACEADKRGRLGMEERSYDQGVFLRDAINRLTGLPALTEGVGVTREWQDRHRMRLDAVRRARHPFRPAAKPGLETC